MTASEQKKIAYLFRCRNRIREVLNIMDENFGEKAKTISSRAVAVSAYLFVEDLFLQKKSARIPGFAEFFTNLLDETKKNLKLLSNFEKPENPMILRRIPKIHLSGFGRTIRH